MDKIDENNWTTKIDNKADTRKNMEIIKILPGGDCGGYGGCGLISCQACALAIDSGASIALCPACSSVDIDAIAKIMGTEPVAAADEVAFIRCAGSSAGKKRFVGKTSCDEAVKDGFITGECRYGCVGIGTCIERCEFGAMSLVDGVVLIDKDKCNGCRACLGICPQELISMVPREASVFIPCASKDEEEMTRKICGSGCIGCKDCEEACPENAVIILDNCAIIDYDKCVGCIACAVSCRKKIIIDEIHDLSKAKEKVAFVRCSGGYRANAKFKALGLETCRDASKIRSAAMDICQTGCVGLSDCIKVCRFDAINIVNGTAKIDADKCVGCLDCVTACPSNLIAEVPYMGCRQVTCSSPAGCDEKLRVCSAGCIGCGDCAANCPNVAITMLDQHAVIDGNLCANCSICTYMCSRGSLAEMAVPEANYLQKTALGLGERK